MSVHTAAAPLVILAFLGTALFVMVTVLIGLVGILRKSRKSQWAEARPPRS